MKAIVYFIAILCAATGVFAEEEPFKGGIRFGVTLTDGNSETESFNVGFEYKHAWDEKNEIILDTDYNYGEADNDKNVDNGKADAQYNRFITERLFGHFHSSFETDDIADLDHRVIVGLGPGLGVQWVDTEDNLFATEIGFSYFDAKQAGVTDNGVLLRLAQRFEHRFNDHARFGQSLEYLPKTDDFGEYLLNAEAFIESGFTSRLSVRLAVENKHNSNPGEDIEKNDLTFKGGIVLGL